MDLNSYNGIVRLNTDGTVDLSFNPGTGTLNPNTSISDSIYAMTLQPDGNIFIGGRFHHLQPDPPHGRGALVHERRHWTPASWTRLTTSMPG